MSQHSGVFWVDASVRINKSIKPLLDLAVQNGGVAAAHNDTVFVWRVTFSQMYMYLPSDLHRLAWYGGTASGCVLFYRTKFTYWNILHWWVLCALEQFCMAPAINKIKCVPPSKESGMLKSAHLKCHRYDQSALSIIFANLFDFQRDAYTVKHYNGSVSIMRRPTSYHKLKYCDTTSR